MITNVRQCLLSVLLVLFLVVPAVGGATTYYVDASRPDDGGSGLSWTTAKQTIQAAVDLAGDGDSVVVTNGAYDLGGAVTPGHALTNRVCVTQAIHVVSVNGPDVTSIVGEAPQLSVDGYSAIRCVCLVSNAVLDGFTLMSGHTMTVGDADLDRSGGGANCFLGGRLTNCVITGNSSGFSGGGCYYGILDNCDVSGNLADYGGGSYYSVLNNCTIHANSAVLWGGGTFKGVLNNCIISGNTADSRGGGSFYGTLNNCLLIDNKASQLGGGIFDGVLNNCTLSANSCSFGGGCYQSKLHNCIVYGNSASVMGDNYQASTMEYCCTTPDPGGTGNIVADPLFTDPGTNNFKLNARSPAINVGFNATAPTNVTPYDLEGAARIQWEVVDMGAYESGTSGDILILASNGSVIVNNEGSGILKGTDFGRVEVSTFSTRLFNLTNPAPSEVELLSCKISGSGAAWFSVSGFPSSIKAGAREVIEVSYKASASPGTYTATVAVVSSSTNSPYLLNLRGESGRHQSIENFIPVNGSVFGKMETSGLSAEASSGLDVEFAVSDGPGIISGGTNLAFTGTGVVAVVASQGGDNVWFPATDVTHLFLVGISRRPELVWSTVPGAQWYRLWIERGTNKYYETWVEGTNSWTAWFDFNCGDYTWWTKPWASASLDSDDWSVDKSFQIECEGPPFEWDAISGSTWYRVWIEREGDYYWDTWLEQTSTSWLPAFDLDCGSYTWYVQGWSRAGYSTWSSPYAMDLDCEMIPAHEMRTTEKRPEFSWVSTPGANAYWIYISRNDRFYQSDWVWPNSWVPPKDLQPGTYQWWFRPWGPWLGFGPWSPAATFFHPTL